LYALLGGAGGGAGLEDGGGALYALLGAAGGAGGGATGFWICPSPICWTGTTVGMLMPDMLPDMAVAPAAKPKRMVEARILKKGWCLCLVWVEKFKFMESKRFGKRVIEEDW